MEAGMMKNTDNNTWILNYYYFDCRWCSFNGCERRASVIDKSLLFLIQLSARIYVENVNLNAPSERIRESGIPTHFAPSLESILSPGIFFSSMAAASEWLKGKGIDYVILSYLGRIPAWAFGFCGHS